MNYTDNCFILSAFLKNVIATFLVLENIILLCSVLSKFKHPKKNFNTIALSVLFKNGT